MVNVLAACMTSLVHGRDGTVLEGGWAAVTVVPALLCIVLVLGCEVFLGFSPLSGLPGGWKDTDEGVLDLLPWSLICGFWVVFFFQPPLIISVLLAYSYS